MCWIAECELCTTPMVVWRWHGTEPSADQLAHMHDRLAEVAEATVGAHYVDDNMRNIPDHYHAHGRPEGGFFGHAIKRERLAEWQAAELRLTDSVATLAGRHGMRVPVHKAATIGEAARSDRHRQAEPGRAAVPAGRLRGLPPGAGPGAGRRARRSLLSTAPAGSEPLAVTVDGGSVTYRPTRRRGHDRGGRRRRGRHVGPGRRSSTGPTGCTSCTPTWGWSTATWSTSSGAASTGSPVGSRRCGPCGAAAVKVPIPPGSIEADGPVSPLRPTRTRAVHPRRRRRRPGRVPRRERLPAPGRMCSPRPRSTGPCARGRPAGRPRPARRRSLLVGDDGRGRGRAAVG